MQLSPDSRNKLLRRRRLYRWHSRFFGFRTTPLGKSRFTLKLTHWQANLLFIFSYRVNFPCCRLQALSCFSLGSRL